MPIHLNYSEIEILEKINSSRNNYICISIKSNQYTNLVVRFAILVEDDTYILYDIKNPAYFFRELLTIVYKKSITIYLYDLKYFFKTLLKNIEKLDIISNFSDIRIQLYNALGRHVSLLDDLIISIAKQPFDKKLIEFYENLFGFRQFSWQLIDLCIVVKLVVL